jgi:hypothetical protein
MNDILEEPSQEKVKIRADLSFGLSGHESEYLFIAEIEGNLPVDIGETIKLELGSDWDVLDRGDRIEIGNKKEYGFRDDQKIMSAFQKAASDRYDLRYNL